MLPTELSQVAGTPIVPPDLTYEDVRHTFMIRLPSEQTRLAVLAAALGCANDAPAPAFCDLEWFAHRLRGAAAIFDFPALREASKVLELAANAALAGRAALNEPRVQAAIGALAASLTLLTGGSPRAEDVGAIPAF